MSKKGKEHRRENYKKFLDGQIKFRESFVTKKLALVEKMLSDDALKSKIINKSRKEMNKLERACVDTMITRKFETVEQFSEIKDKIKEQQVKKAKFQYAPKNI